MPKNEPKADVLLGMTVLREFPDFGFFTGTVLNVEDKSRYRLRYTDGDFEIVTRTKVIELLHPRGPCVYQSVQLSGDGARVRLQQMIPVCAAAWAHFFQIRIIEPLGKIVFTQVVPKIFASNRLDLEVGQQRAYRGHVAVWARLPGVCAPWC